MKERARVVHSLVLVTLLLSLGALVPGPVLAKLQGWTQVGLRGQALSSVAASPQYDLDRTLFAGGDGQVWRSSDGGRTWTPHAVAEGTVVDLAVSPAFESDETVFAAVDSSGLYRSTDGGDTWDQVFAHEMVTAVVLSPAFARDGTAYLGAARVPSAGVHRSTDGGDSWRPASAGMPNVFVYSLAISPGYETDRTLLAGTNAWVCQTTNSGDQWQWVLGGVPRGAFAALALPPNFPQQPLAFAAEAALVFRGSSGSGWQGVRATAQPVTALAVSPAFAADRRVFAGTAGGGLLVSTDGGAAWAPANTGLGNLDVRDLAVVSQPALMLFAATADGLWRTTLDSAPWLAVAPPALGFLAETGSDEAMVRRLTVGGTAGLDWTAAVTPPADWLSLEPLAGTIPGTLTVTANARGLVTGTYTTSLVIDAGLTAVDSPWTLPVRLAVGPLAPGYLPLVPRDEN
jgi:photosystem II stability/assembly factor-like uncharacterized protein